MDAVEFQWGGEHFVALAERALWWPRRRTLCVADIHLGKAAAFRHAGVPVPESTTDADLGRLSRLINRWSPSRLLILGDLLHSRSGRSTSTMSAFGEWRAGFPALEVVLVRGNHDLHAGDPPGEWRVRVENAPFADEYDCRIVLGHDPESSIPHADNFLLCGHIHPAVSIQGTTNGIRAPCLWLGARVGVLPAFGSFTGTMCVAPKSGDRIFAIGSGEIVEIPCGLPVARRLSKTGRAG